MCALLQRSPGFRCGSAAAMQYQLRQRDHDIMHNEVSPREARLWLPPFAVAARDGQRQRRGELGPPPSSPCDGRCSDGAECPGRSALPSDGMAGLRSRPTAPVAGRATTRAALGRVGSAWSPACFLIWSPACSRHRAHSRARRAAFPRRSAHPN